MIPNGYLIFEDESFLDSTVAKMNALRKSGQFCDVRLQVRLTDPPESARQRLVLLLRLPSPIQPLRHKEPWVFNELLYFDNMFTHCINEFA